MSDIPTMEKSEAMIAEMRGLECWEALKDLVGLVQLVAPTIEEDRAHAMLHSHRYRNAKRLLKEIENLEPPE
jgi:hypothetical protein